MSKKSFGTVRVVILLTALIVGVGGYGCGGCNDTLEMWNNVAQIQVPASVDIRPCLPGVDQLLATQDVDFYVNLSPARTSDILSFATPLAALADPQCLALIGTGTLTKIGTVNSPSFELNPDWAPAPQVQFLGQLFSSTVIATAQPVVAVVEDILSVWEIDTGNGSISFNIVVHVQWDPTGTSTACEDELVSTAFAMDPQTDSVMDTDPARLAQPANALEYSQTIQPSCPASVTLDAISERYAGNPIVADRRLIGTAMSQPTIISFNVNLDPAGSVAGVHSDRLIAILRDAITGWVYRAPLNFELTIRSGGGGGGGPTAPTCSIDPIVSVQSGIVTINYSTVDPDAGELLSLNLEYADTTLFKPASPTPSVSGVAPASGQTYNWQSQIDLSGYYGQVAFRISVTDIGGNRGSCSVQFTVDNRVSRCPALSAVGGIDFDWVSSPSGMPMVGVASRFLDTLTMSVSGSGLGSVENLAVGSISYSLTPSSPSITIALDMGGVPSSLAIGSSAQIGIDVTPSAAGHVSGAATINFSFGDGYGSTCSQSQIINLDFFALGSGRDAMLWYPRNMAAPERWSNSVFSSYKSCFVVADRPAGLFECADAITPGGRLMVSVDYPTLASSGVSPGGRIINIMAIDRALPLGSQPDTAHFTGAHPSGATDIMSLYVRDSAITDSKCVVMPSVTALFATAGVPTGFQEVGTISIPLIGFSRSTSIGTVFYDGIVATGESSMILNTFYEVAPSRTATTFRPFPDTILMGHDDVIEASARIRLIDSATGTVVAVPGLLTPGKTYRIMVDAYAAAPATLPFNFEIVTSNAYSDPLARHCANNIDTTLIVR